MADDARSLPRASSPAAAHSAWFRPPVFLRRVWAIARAEFRYLLRAPLTLVVILVQPVMLLSAAKTWTFRPALRDGRPVKFRLRITVPSTLP